MKILWITVVFIFCLGQFSSAQRSSLQEFKDGINQRLSSDARVYIRNTILSTNETLILVDAVHDLLEHSKTESDWNEAVTAIDKVISDATPGSGMLRSARLAKGRALMRLGREGESKEIFESVVSEGQGLAVYFYTQSYIEARKFDAASKIEFKRATGIGGYHQNFRRNREDLLHFHTLVRQMKSVASQQSAMEIISSITALVTEHSNAVDIAHALCLSEDKRYEEAKNLLNQVETELVNSNSLPDLQNSDEYRTLPLYQTSIILQEGTELDSARTHFMQFMQRNQDDPKRVYQAAMHVVRDMEMDFDRYLPHANIITSELLKSGIVLNATDPELISENDVAGLYDLHALSLAWDGQYEEAVQIQKMVMDKYYPHTLAGANCAMNWARDLYWRHQDKEGAISYLNGILVNAPYAEIVPWVKYSMAQIQANEGNLSEALLLANEVIALVEDKTGSIIQAELLAQELKSQMLKRN